MIPPRPPLRPLTRGPVHSPVSKNGVPDHLKATRGTIHSLASPLVYEHEVSHEDRDRRNLHDRHNVGC